MFGLLLLLLFGRRPALAQGCKRFPEMVGASTHHETEKSFDTKDARRLMSRHGNNAAATFAIAKVWSEFLGEAVIYYDDRRPEEGCIEFVV